MIECGLWFINHDSIAIFVSNIHCFSYTLEIYGDVIWRGWLSMLGINLTRQTKVKRVNLAIGAGCAAVIRVLARW